MATGGTPWPVFTPVADSKGAIGAPPPPIGSYFSSKSRFFLCKRHIFRCAHLRQISAELINCLFIIFGYATGLHGTLRFSWNLGWKPLIRLLAVAIVAVLDAVDRASASAVPGGSVRRPRPQHAEQFPGSVAGGPARRDLPRRCAQHAPPADGRRHDGRLQRRDRHERTAARHRRPARPCSHLAGGTHFQSAPQELLLQRQCVVGRSVRTVCCQWRCVWSSSCFSLLQFGYYLHYRHHRCHFRKKQLWPTADTVRQPENQAISRTGCL